MKNVTLSIAELFGLTVNEDGIVISRVDETVALDVGGRVVYAPGYGRLEKGRQYFSLVPEMAGKPVTPALKAATKAATTLLSAAAKELMGGVLSMKAAAKGGSYSWGDSLLEMPAVTKAAVKEINGVLKSATKQVITVGFSAAKGDGKSARLMYPLREHLREELSGNTVNVALWVHDYVMGLTAGDSIDPFIGPKVKGSLGCAIWLSAVGELLVGVSARLSTLISEFPEEISAAWVGLEHLSIIGEVGVAPPDFADGKKMLSYGKKLPPQGSILDDAPLTPAPPTELGGWDMAEPQLPPPTPPTKTWNVGRHPEPLSPVTPRWVDTPPPPVAGLSVGEYFARQAADSRVAQQNALFQQQQQFSSNQRQPMPRYANRGGAGQFRNTIDNYPQRPVGASRAAAPSNEVPWNDTPQHPNSYPNNYWG
jgi:hypothetical protein